MSRESKTQKAERAVAVLESLDRSMPDARIELDYETPLQLLIAVMLSAQSTDKRVNMITPALFQAFPDVQSFAKANAAAIEPYIQTCGLFRNKAKNVVAAARALVAEHGGTVPISRDALAALPGVGNKTAGVVSIHLGGDDAFPVDTHILRLSYRLGFSNQTHPDKVEADLRKLLPSAWWKKGHQLLIWHGRRTCFARKPACDECVVRPLCPRRGVAKARAQ